MRQAPGSEQPAVGRLRALVYAVTLPWIALIASGSDGQLAYYLLGVALLGGLLCWLDRVRLPARAARPLRTADLLLWNLVLAVLLLEAGTRAYLAWGHPPSWLVLEPDQLRYRLDPTRDYLGFRPNSRGFHDQEFPLQKDPGVLRVVALGDSFAVGMVPYPEVYLTLVDEQLGDGVEIDNLGVVHMAAREYLETLQTDGLGLAPDVVLVGIFLGNDIRPDPRRGLFSAGGSRAIAALRRALTLTTAEHRASPLESDAAPFREQPDGTRVELPLLSMDEYLDKEARHLERIFRPPQDRYMKTAWRDIEAALRELVALCRERRIALLATLAPDELQVIPGLVERVAQARGLDPQGFDLSYPVQRLRAMFESRGVPVLDLTPALRAAEAEAPTYHERGVHWNRHGNVAAARAVTPWLREQLAAQGLPARAAGQTRSFTSVTP